MVVWMPLNSSMSPSLITSLDRYDEIYNESIYNLVPKPPEVKIKPERYISAYSAQVKAELKRSSHKTMGYAKTPVATPKEYLRKRDARDETFCKPSISFSYGERRKAPVPRPGPQHPVQAPRNYLHENILNVVISTPPRTKTRSVDTRQGHSFILDQSGLVPKYSIKQNFGRVPYYLKSSSAKMMYDGDDRGDEFEQGTLLKIDEPERQQILQGLKHNLGELQCRYLNLSVTTDTLSKRNRKLRLEAEIGQLEKDINVLERHPIIYVMPLAI